MDTVLTPNQTVPVPKSKNRAWERFKKNKSAVFGLVVIILLILAAIFAPYIARHDPAEQDLLKVMKPASAEHWFGTDDLGRDVFSRTLYAARVSLTVSISAVLLNMVIGILVGAIAGYYGGKVDAVLMRFIDIMNSFPVLFVLIIVVTMVKASIFLIIAVLVAFGWMNKARLLRAEMLSVKNREYIDAARTMGFSAFRIIFRHALPNAIAPVIVSATLQLGGMILLESTLSYLGLGVQPPTPTWGNMLLGAQTLTIMMKAPWLAIIPGLCIFITVMCFNLVGDGLRNAFDSKQG